MRHIRLFLVLLLTTLPFTPPSRACTRVVYHGANGEVITARSMDWKVDIGTNLWIFPRGIRRTGEAGSHSVQWTSKYGSIIASGYDIFTTDGMNEKGLVVNLLWLDGASSGRGQAGKSAHVHLGCRRRQRGRGIRKGQAGHPP